MHAEAVHTATYGFLDASSRQGSTFIFLGGCITGQTPAEKDAAGKLVAHELGHVLGLHHEHQRCEREDAITLLTPKSPTKYSTIGVRDI